MNAIEILRAASRSVPNEDYVHFMAAVDAVEAVVEAMETLDYLWGESAVRGVDFSHAIEQARAAIAGAKGEFDGR